MRAEVVLGLTMKDRDIVATLHEAVDGVTADELSPPNDQDAHARMILLTMVRASLERRHPAGATIAAGLLRCDSPLS
jgi:hypothetical protein